MSVPPIEAFYERVGDGRFLSSAYTAGPWSPDAQHAGPPAALLALAVDEHPQRRPDFRIARMSYEILRPVPVAPLTVRTRVLRAGRSTELVEAALAPEGGGEVMRATGLLVKTSPGSVPEVRPAPEVPGPDDAFDRGFFPIPWEQGYHTAVELRFAAGSVLETGPATGWFRMRVPLVLGEEIAPLSRVLVAADSGNGISSVVDFDRYLFVNTDLTVNVDRHPQGEWVCLDARTTVDAAGIGLAQAALHDEKGPLGRSSQTLYVAPRG
ncbi:thioesterase family protein [Streptomyces polyrhachis]|uniref:Thioesterase family protein n=1 Tax=Streptomyces polyrhachis TaxID=1282885 RepID=A0ABW2GG93_9ACTN